MLLPTYVIFDTSLYLSESNSRIPWSQREMGLLYRLNKVHLQSTGMQ